MNRVVLLVLLLFTGVAPTHAEATHAETADASPSADFSFGRFGKVALYQPQGTPRRVVLFLSGDGGWHLGVTHMARRLRDDGALVVGLDIRAYLDALGRSKSCNNLAVDFEELSHAVQKKLHLPAYLAPILAGYSSGATVVYAALAQAPRGTFAGAISLGFCPDQDFRKVPLCRGTGIEYAVNARGDFVFAPAKKLGDRWIALQGQQDQVCDPHAVDTFAAAMGESATVYRLTKVGHGFGVEKNWLPQLEDAVGLLAPPARATANAPAIGDLPLETQATAATGDTLALLLTGDGGWAGLDREVSARLAARGLPVVALDSLRYFWHARTPEETTRDVVRVLRHFLAAWHREHIVLVGYSFGADAMPFVVGALPADLRARVSRVALLGLSDSASFEVHVADWLPGVSTQGIDLRPALERMHDLPIVCIYGAGEADTVCPALHAKNLQAVQIGNGHHFGNEYDALVAAILRHG